MPSVIVGNLDIVRTIVLPSKANPPLVVDADGVLAISIAFQGFQPIAWR